MTPKTTTAPPTAAPEVRRNESSTGATGSPPSAAAAASSPPAQDQLIEWQVLFVGPDRAWFDQIESRILSLRPTWACRHVPDSESARVEIASHPVDALVLEGTVADGPDLLAQAEAKLPRVICLVRCNFLDRQGTGRWHRLGATLVPEKAGATTLVGALARTARLREWMQDPVIKKLLPSFRKLPAESRLHQQVVDELQSPNGSMQVVARLISQDPLMSAKILQVVNSVFFGLARDITDTVEAVMVLGAEQIKSLILLAGVFSQYGDSKCSGFSPEALWAHSVQTGSFARSIALAETGKSSVAEAAFTAGLLHDIGKLIVAANLPEMYESVTRFQLSKKITQREAELIILGTTHAQLGACLLATWGLPLPILEAIAWHHEPEKSPEKGFSLLAAVHVANVFAQESVPNKGAENGIPRDHINLGFLLRSGLGDCQSRWLKCCGLEGTPAQTEEEKLLRRREAKEN